MAHQSLAFKTGNGARLPFRAAPRRSHWWAVGLAFEALVNVTMDREDADTVAAFEAALAAVPEIRHAERLFGDPAYLLRVVAVDLNDYATLPDHRLATLPGVQRLTSTIVMKRIVDNRPLPLLGLHSRTVRRAAIASR